MVKIPENLINIKVLSLDSYNNVYNIIKHFISLEELRLDYCNDIKMIPEQLTKLNKLYITNSDIEIIPKNIKEIVIKNCKCLN